MNWSKYHKRKSQNTQKNDQISSLHKSLVLFFTKRSTQDRPYGSHFSESPMTLLSYFKH